jgi:hypothetical protein
MAVTVAGLLGWGAVATAPWLANMVVEAYWGEGKRERMKRNRLRKEMAAVNRAHSLISEDEDVRRRMRSMLSDKLPSQAEQQVLQILLSGPMASGITAEEGTPEQVSAALDSLVGDTRPDFSQRVRAASGVPVSPLARSVRYRPETAVQPSILTR